MNIKTCILLFSRTAENEAKHKQLHSVKSRNQLLHKKLQNRCMDAIHASNLPLRHFDEFIQHGNSFAEKLTNAVTKVFKEFDHIIVIGSDCPTLDEQDLLKASNSLLSENQVLGENGRGGTYLIGLTKSAWNPEAFLAIEWNTGRVAVQLEHLLSDTHGLLRLGKKLDINQLHDLLKIKTLVFTIKQFIQVLLQSLQVATVSSSVPMINRTSDLLLTLPFRGPPLLLK